MKILYAAFDEVPSFKGASTHILSGLRYAAESHQVTLVTLGSYCIPARKGLNHRPVLIQEKNYLRRALLFREHIERVISKNSFDLMHFRGPFEGVPIVSLGCPSVYEVNAFPSIELPYHYSNLTEQVLERIREYERFCLKNASRIICPSIRIKECILEHAPLIGADKIEVLPNGYDPVEINLNIVSQDESVIRGVYLGTLSPWQGVHWALKAFRDIGPKFTLDIFSPYQKIHWRRLERRIARYGLQQQVRLFPAVNQLELSQILPQYDFAIAPLLKTERNTEQGCCPLKILEYLRHGLPTVAPDLFVVKELIQDENYPFYFHPNSILSLKTALLSLSEHKFDAPLRASMQRLLSNHPTWDAYSRSLTRLYEAGVTSC